MNDLRPCSVRFLLGSRLVISYRSMTISPFIATYLEKSAIRCPIIPARGSTAHTALEPRGPIPTLLALKDICQPCVVPGYRNLDSAAYRVFLGDRISGLEQCRFFLKPR